MFFAKYHLPAILYGIAILAISSVPNLKPPEIGWWATDKVAHFVEYGAFAILLFRSISRLEKGLARRHRHLLTLLGLAMFAVIDEVLQGFRPGRFADPLDFLSDVLGGSVALLVYWFTRRKMDRIRR